MIDETTPTFAFKIGDRVRFADDLGRDAEVIYIIPDPIDGVHYWCRWDNGAEWGYPAEYLKRVEEVRRV
jgi:hypothetical protein